MSLREEQVDLPGLQPGPDLPFGLYVHVPFCITRCGYCDFNTYTPAELGGVNPDAWLRALRAELGLAAARLDSPTVDTVFVGGGTPSLLGGARVAAVLDMVRDHFALAPDAEVTTEANPESAWPDFFEATRAAGYTRVSLGMQSLELDMGNDIQYVALTDAEKIERVARSGTATITAQMPQLATRNFFSDAAANTTGVVSITHGIEDGARVGLTLRKVQITDITYQEMSGTVGLQMQLALLPTLVASEFAITVR